MCKHIPQCLFVSELNGGQIKRTTHSVINQNTMTVKAKHIRNTITNSNSLEVFDIVCAQLPTS